MPHIIGIDLGTTNTAVAVLENGRPRVIEDERGYKVLPSVVSAKGEGRFVVGQAAHSLILTRPERTVFATKRLMGRRFDSPEVQRIRKRVGYTLREAPDGGVEVQVGEAWMTPQEVAAVVLQVARGIAEKGLGEPVEEAVITVPAHFNHAQRKATLEAAEIAGLRCERLLNEPTAAALAYGHRKNVDRTLVIFDLGGGTFDVSVLRLSSGIYEILATNGDTFLGGEDFDYRILDFLVDAFKTRTNVDIRNDKSALQRVKDAAERAKCELSFSERANVVVPHIAPGQNLETLLTRSQLELITGDLIDTCVEVVRAAVLEAGIAISEIDEVILVGGQTRMPRVREAVAGLFGREPSRSVHPEEAVAIGAAVHAAALGDVEGTPAVLLDITPFDLGIDAAGGLFSRILPKNSRVPCTETRTFATVHDDQSTVKIVVRQGEGRLAQENEFIGEFLFEGLTPAPRMQTKVAVTFRIDANGMLHVTALEPSTGERRNIGIRNYADHARQVVRPAQPARPEAAPAAPTPAVARKKGFFDQLFGGRKTGPRAPARSAPPVVEPPAEFEPPPFIAALPPPEALPPDTLAPIDGSGLAEIDGDEGEFAMPEDFPEDELYEQSSASFGLAGAHQLGQAAPGADPFADVSPRRAPTTTLSYDPFGGEVGETIVPDGEPASALDAADLFGDDFEGDEDPPTDPGLGGITPSTPSGSAMPSGLHFEALVESEADMAFSFDEHEADAPVVRAEAAAVASFEDDLGFSFDPPASPGVADAPDPADDLGFSFDSAKEDDVGFSFEPAKEEEVGLSFEPAKEEEVGLSFEPAKEEEVGFSFEPEKEEEVGLSFEPAKEEEIGFSFEPEKEEGVNSSPEPAKEEEVDFSFEPAKEEEVDFSFEPAKEADDPEASLAAREEAFLAELEPVEDDPFGFAFVDNVPPIETPRIATPAPRAPSRDTLAADDDDTFVFPSGDEPPAEKKVRKPARVRLQYRERAQLVLEYTENLRNGGATIRTEKPLAMGRECIFEISGPGLAAPLIIPARVSRVLADGMEVIYMLGSAERAAVLAALY